MNLPKVYKRILPNGLTVLAVERDVIPKVSTQLWYNVGSKDELSGEKGIAHLIEHMIFKGTEKLSECDINLITHKLSGYTNAFTSYDYTGYLFDFPAQHWQEALPIMADCMTNALFKEEFLNSELQAVIQELKMYRDDYASSILEYLVSALFYDHPYHHPIIGYKQDLWSLKREALVNFYKRHYVPNNATLIVVGNVDHKTVFDKAEKNFGQISPNKNYVKHNFYHSPDLRNYSLTIYRDIKQPMVILSWVVPGAKNGNDYLIEIVSWVTAMGKGSRLYKKLVDELELVTDIEAFNYDLFDYGLFFIYFHPKKILDTDLIVSKIHEELQNMLKKADLKEQEIIRAVKKTEVDYLALLENNQKQAYAIGKYFLATGDEQYLYTYTEYSKTNLQEKIKEFIGEYLRPSVTNQAKVLPIEQSEKKYWLKLQEVSDQEDQRVLSSRARTSEVEPGKCVYTVKVKPPEKFDFPKTKTAYLNNGLKILYYNNPQLPKIDLIVDFKAKYYYDPENFQGLGSFVAALLLEGTKNYSAQAFADTLESHGMTLNCYAGYITMSMLSIDLVKGLGLLNEILTQATFEPRAIERVRSQMIADYNQYWDQPSKFITQLLKQQIYKNHPYSKSVLGTLESLHKISRDDIVNYYNKFLSPRSARLSIVGDLERYDIKDCMEHMLSNWKGQEISDLEYPSIENLKHEELNYPIMRDQIVLGYGAPSVNRLDNDYDKLLIFDQIFTGGVLGSMSSRLFDLREKSGLFYTISGSLIANVDKQPGIIVVKTIVSNDRLAEAEKAIENLINTAIDEVSQEEFDEAKRAITNSLIDNFESNSKIAATAISRDYYDFPQDYFDKRAEQLMVINIETMQDAVRKYLKTERMVKIRVGRI